MLVTSFYGNRYFLRVSGPVLQMEPTLNLGSQNVKQNRHLGTPSLCWLFTYSEIRRKYANLYFVY